MAIKEILLPTGKTVYDIYVQVWTPYGKRIQKRKRGVPTLKQAKVAEIELRAELLLEKGKPASVTWNMWTNRVYREMVVQLRPTTVQNYQGQLGKWITPLWGQRKLEDISSFDVHHAIYHCMDGVSPNTRRSILKMIAKMFQRAVENGVIARNPALPVKVKVPEPKQAVLTASEAQKLLIEAKHLGHRFYTVWAIALFTGMRSGELYALRWDDVDLEHNRIFVTRSWCSKAGFGPTKSQKNRVVPVSQSLRDLLLEIKASQLQKGQSEFVLPHLSEWQGGTQALVLRDFCKSIGITPVKFHDLRATFITQMLMRGVPLAQVMSIVGHNQLKTTNTYLRVVGTDLAGATEKLSYSLPITKLAEVVEFNGQKR